ncbi:MAG: hypothetical protein M3O30_16000 [Planctomycetota bacterium]|nr:hypothetical protein [Planctomycetota bacterium]
MRAGHHRATALHLAANYITFGLMGQIAGALILPMMTFDHEPWGILMGNLLLVLGTSVLMVGCGIIATTRGRHQAWGLLGLLSIPGVGLLLCLRTPRRKNKGGFEVRYLAPYRRDVWKIDIRVRLDPSLGTGIAEPIVLQIARGANVAGAVKMLAGALPALRQNLADLAYQINGQCVTPAYELVDGNELCLGRSVQGDAEQITLPPAQTSAPLS